jgi:hypothetical protein
VLVLALVGCGDRATRGSAGEIQAACTQLLLRERSLQRGPGASGLPEFASGVRKAITAAAAHLTALRRSGDQRGALRALVADLDQEAAVMGALQSISATAPLQPAARQKLVQAEAQRFAGAYLSQVKELSALGASGGCVATRRVGQPAPAARPIAATSTCTRMMVFPYGAPQPTWNQAVAAKSAVGAIVLNVLNGPGFFPYGESTYSVRTAEQSGIHVLGYVYPYTTVGGMRPLTSVERDVSTWAQYYPLSGYFIDNVVATPRNLTYYRNLVTFIRKTVPGAYVLMNVSPGALAPAYLALGNLLNVFEGKPAKLARWRSYPLMKSYPARRFGAIVYASPASELAQVLSLIRRQNVGNVYVADREFPNPYFELASYFDREVQLLARGCQVSG